jgi:hypothetical protein
MLTVFTPSFFAAVAHGMVIVPLLWIVGVILLVAGVVSLLRGGLVVGIVLIVAGILLGGLNVF